MVLNCKTAKWNSSDGCHLDPMCQFLLQIFQFGNKISFCAHNSVFLAGATNLGGSRAICFIILYYCYTLVGCMFGEWDMKQWPTSSKWFTLYQHRNFYEISKFDHNYWGEGHSCKVCWLITCYTHCEDTKLTAIYPNKRGRNNMFL